DYYCATWDASLSGMLF
nr:immunoglobulin light chain junction region [Macaca mulatta]MOW06501.1 immunoglobulin light chain junction region [Macaca mulatta]